MLTATLLALAACGGGGGASPEPLPPAGGDGSYADPAAYSSRPEASLASATEGVATTRHTLTLGGTAIAYTAKAGHLTARDPATAQPKASFFYVAYTADNPPAATRPVTFFYNGGPGSASVWLHLGSFGPKRLVTGVPGTVAASPFPLVDNEHSLLDVTDLVFVDAVGSGLSQAIAPHSNQSFWGVDSDAAAFRDFVLRYAELYGRSESPKFLFGESYGGTRTAVLAPLLEAAGMRLHGVVLQSPALDYNSNCGVASVRISCAGYLPSYGSIGAYHGLVSPPPADAATFAQQLRAFTLARQVPAIDALLLGAAVPADLPPLLFAATGFATSQWQADLNLGPGLFQQQLLTGSLIGRYDGRMSAANGSALAREGDPSSTYIGPSFNSAIQSHLRTTLRYTWNGTYVLLSGAIERWDFTHDGQALPDSIPDLATALVQNPALRVLALNGYHDLATPFFQTERDLARLGANPHVRSLSYPGGHMTYLDDTSRPLAKADLAAFYRDALTGAAP
jgi:carboxypeptidase C (cathepsin A)